MGKDGGSKNEAITGNVIFFLNVLRVVDTKYFEVQQNVIFLVNQTVHIAPEHHC